MRILALSFSGTEASVALSGPEGLREARMARNAGGGTPGTLVAEVLADAAGMERRPLAAMERRPLTAMERRPPVGQCDAVAVALGPGSYTGIRMAVSFAKTFALVRGLPLFALSDHAVLAAEAFASCAAATSCVVIHGGHGQHVYASRWRADETPACQGSATVSRAVLPVEDVAPRLCTPADALALAACDAAAILVGDRTAAASPWPSAAQLAALVRRAAVAGAAPSELLCVEPVLPAL